LEEEELAKSPIMIFANKYDLEDKMNPDEISEILKLGDIKERDWAIFKTSAITGEGLQEAFDWLVKTIKQKNN
jgi:ADP-ribosylation factor-like protein 1